MALDRQQIVDEALRLLDDEGLDALSLRTLASRLGVRAPTLYWHVKSKAELLDALADAIMDEAIGALPQAASADGWAGWLLAALSALRAALLRHRDGARVVSGARLALRRADFSEAAMSTLVAHGVELQRARLTVLAGERFTVGYVLEEQAPVDPAQQPPDLGELQRRFPVMTRAIGEYFSTGRGSDDLYRDIARLILGQAARG
ncbi:TetR family transcriptional regulator [Agromyces protaetiae]|uniref:TetR family transcriptional regulator n=1 Tax=Agromyces protaetiae TaxID=2509455 RepID=A0A4P6FFL6_9MICO|nr:TetR/AcrR family transcriptional regulator C-terminal domain-containing protein [Agromyces protaetiae]QAY72567.1 TetR family transcriptional regulator [Agromyces protaetiae]